jgi:hypothetical protein
MKNLYAFLLVAFFCCMGNAQIVNIPDPVFKTTLLETAPSIDTNADGEIQESEALAVTDLSLFHCTLENVIGLEAFSNLEHLDFGAYCYIGTPVVLSSLTHLKSLGFNKSGMPSVDLAGLNELESIGIGYASPNFLNFYAPTNLKSLSYYKGTLSYPLDLSQFPNLVSFFISQTGGVQGINLDGLTHLESFKFSPGGGGETLNDNNFDISDLVSLKRFELSGSQVTHLDFHNSPLLEELSWFSGNISSINASNLTNLKKLALSGSNLTELDLSGDINLQKLFFPSSQMTSLDLTGLTKLDDITVSGGQFTTLDFSGQTEITDGSPVYDFSNCPNLTSVNIKNGKFDAWGLSNSNCPNLIYLCVDDIEMESLAYSFTGINFNTYCDFVPGGNFNTITGMLTYYSEGCGNGSAIPMPNTKVTINDGADSGIAFTDQNGRYNFYTQSGNFTLTPEFANPIFGVNPENATVGFTDNLSNTETRDFCLSAVGTVENLEISLIPFGARPGFDAHYQLVYKNTGNQTMSGNVALAYNDSVLDLVQTNPATNTQSSGNLSWNYTQLLPFETRSIDITFNVNSPMETPAVNIGDVLHFDATIYPIIAGANNHASLDQVVVGSFDPNDKTCLEGETIPAEKVGDYLNYVIRFQNSGTAATENIVVTDVLDTDAFEVDSFQLVASSHPQMTRISGNKVEFVFEGINLPTEQDDETGSHGFVAFRIRTKNNLTAGASVSNKADIFFDYNFPITTNTATSVFQLLARSQFEDSSVAVYPNPAKNQLTISAKDSIKSTQLYDAMGRLIETDLQNSSTVSFDISRQTSGIYFLKIVTEKGSKTEKIIKE